MQKAKSIEMRKLKILRIVQGRIYTNTGYKGIENSIVSETETIYIFFQSKNKLYIS